MPEHPNCIRSPIGPVKPHNPINVGEVLRALQGAGRLGQYRTRRPIGAIRRPAARRPESLWVTPTIGFVAGVATPLSGLAMGVAPVRSDIGIALIASSAQHAAFLPAWGLTAGESV